MKIRTIASGLTHLLFTSLIALAAAKSAPDTAPAEADSAPEKPTRTAETQIASQPASMIDADRKTRSTDTLRPEDRAVPAPEEASDEGDAAADLNPSAPPSEDEPSAARTPGGTAAPEPPVTPEPANALLMRRLVAAYPDFLAGYEDNTIIWHDGTRMRFDDGREKSFKERLNAPRPRGSVLCRISTRLARRAAA